VSAVTHLVVGPDEHGVTRYALACARAVDGVVVRVAHRLRPADVPGLLRRLPAGAPVHLHLTDHLLGPGPDEAAEVVERLARRVRLTLTLHDLPQATDGAAHAARARCYARAAAAACGVVVSSDHELGLLRAALGEGAGALEDRVAVVPHLVHPRRRGVRGWPAPAPTAPRDVVVLGFVYPGKGHVPALDALAGLDADVGLVALGAASPGHRHLVDDLADRARRLGRRFTCTGWVPDDELADHLARAAVPLVAHEHVSASGSLGTWLSAGRRPLAPRNPYVDEVAARLPGAVDVVTDLVTGLRDALADPARTWLADDVRLGPDAGEVGSRVERLTLRWAA
jgi:glycosyltransferase involved in cell wall biosynthesis